MRPFLRSIVVMSGLLATAATWYFVALPSRAHAAGAQERVIRSEALGNGRGAQLTAVVVSYAPGGKSPSHRHSGSVFAYVLSGAIRSQNSATGPVKVYAAGESFFEPAGSIHLVSENASDTQPASMLAVFVAPSGSQLTSANH
jgi:quercetin dioxygenase-like cupin family protein